MSFTTALLPIMAFVFVAYLVIGIALPVVPIYVRDQLGLSNFIVGLVAGSPFVAALLSRLPAGRFSDRRGPKSAVVAGLLTACAGGVFALASVAASAQAMLSVTFLLLGRAMLGTADSFIITGALSWGLTLLGASSTGKVMAWVGTALYGAFALGAPLGTVLYASHGFAAIAIATITLPLGAMALLAPLSVASSPSAMHVTKMRSVIQSVVQPGFALALSGVGFGAMMAFLALSFRDHDWTPIWGAYVVLSAAFMVGRVFFGGLADTVGGARVALTCMLVEAAGLFLIWLAPSMLAALAGVAMSGFGYSLVYPGLGVEAIKRAPPQRRGITMGAYTAFLDLSLGISGPLLGLVAGIDGLRSVYFASAIVALVGAGVTARLWMRTRIVSNVRAHAAAGD